MSGCQQTPRSNKRHPLSVSTVPLSASSIPSSEGSTEGNAAQGQGFDRFCSVSRNPAAYIEAVASPQAASAQYGGTAAALDMNPYISPSNPISRIALPTISPRAYSELVCATSSPSVGSRSPAYLSRCSRLTPSALSPLSPAPTGFKSGKGLRHQLSSRTRGNSFPPAILHLGGDHPASPAAIASATPADGQVGQGYAMATYPLDLPIQLTPAPSPRSRSSSHRQAGPFALLRLVLPAQDVAFIRRHLFLLLYVILGMLISLTVLVHDHRSLGGARAGVVVDLAVPGISTGHALSARSFSGWKEGERSAMGVWADYADAKKGSGRHAAEQDWLGVYVGSETRNPKRTVQRRVPSGGPRSLHLRSRR